MLAKKIDSHLPKRTKYFLKAYDTGVQHSLEKSKQQPIYRNTTMRVLVNGVIVLIIFSLVNSFILPKIASMVVSFSEAKTFSWLIALLFSSPFLWGMLFSFKRSHRVKEKIYQNILQLIIWLLTIIEISILSIAYFHVWPIVSFLIIISVLYFLFCYKRLEKIYHWFEKQLVSNIKKKVQCSISEKLLFKANKQLSS